MFGTRCVLVCKGLRVLTRPCEDLRLSWRMYAVSGSGTPKPEDPATVDTLVALGVDVVRIRSQCPQVLRYPPARVLATTSALKEFKVDPVRVLRQDIRLWSADPQRWEARLAVLREMDLSIAKLITTCPAVLTHTPETLRAKVETLDRMGLCATKIVNHFPSALGLSGDRVRNTIVFLDGVGLDGVRAVNSVPTLLGYNVDTKLRPTVHFVTVEMGRDIAELQRNPATLCLSLDGRLKPRYAFAELHSHHDLNLTSLFTYTDPRFARSVGQPVEEYQTWLAQYLGR